MKGVTSATLALHSAMQARQTSACDLAFSRAIHGFRTRARPCLGHQAALAGNVLIYRPFAVSGWSPKFWNAVIALTYLPAIDGCSLSVPLCPASAGPFLILDTGISIGIYYNPNMSEPTLFRCPNCDAQYKVVRAEAPPSPNDHEITCLSCGAPLNPRVGKFVLKYFLVGGRRKRGGPRPM